MSDPRLDLSALYRAPLSDFLAERKRLAIELKKAGRRELAERVAKLAKPTPAAWAVNQLLHRCPSDLDRLLALGADLRAAMRAGLQSGATSKAPIADLEARQRELISTLVHAARVALAEQGAASETVLTRVRATLSTLSLTGMWGGAEAGQLTKELDPPGVELMAELLMSGPAAAGAHGGDDSGAAPTTSMAGAVEAAPHSRVEGPSPQEVARRAAAAALARAEERLASATAALRVAQAHRDGSGRQARQRAEERSAAQAVVDALEGRLARAREELTAAERYPFTGSAT